MRTRRSCRRLAVTGAVALLAVLGAGEAAAQEPSVGSCSNYVVNPTSQEFVAGGGENDFSVTWAWTAPPTNNCVYACTSQACGTTPVPPYSSATWITDVELDSGTVSYEVSKNRSENDRDGTITVGNATFTVNQNGLECPGSPIGASTRNVGNGGESFTVTGTADVDCGSYNVSDDQSWIRVNVSSIAGNGSVNITVDPNADARREGTVSIGNASITIRQAAGACPSSPTSVAPSSRRSPYGGETFGVRVNGRSDCSWSVSDDRSWLGASPSSVSGGGTVDVTVASTPDVERSGSVSIGGRSVSITQVHRPCGPSPDSLSPSPINTAHGGGSYSLSMTGRRDCRWNVSDDRSWISVNPSRVLGSESVTVTVSANAGPARSGTVTVGGRSVTVNQADGCMPSWSTGSLAFGKGGGSKSARAGGSSLCSFSVSDNRSWISVGSSVSGGGSVSVSVTANAGLAQSGTVTLSYGNKSASLSVTIADGCMPSGSTSSLSFGSSSGSKPARAGGSSACTFSVSDNRSWISVGSSSVSGGGSVSVSVTANDGPARSGTVTISHQNGSASVSVSQGDGCSASGSTSSLSFSSGSGSKSATAGGSSACTFSVSDNRSWISVGSSSVSGGGSVSVSVTANRGPARSGTVTIGNASVRISQANGCPSSPGGAPSSLDYGSGAASKSVQLTEDAGCPYSVSKDETWITVDPSSVAGNGTVTVSVTANSGGERTGTVTVGTASVSVTQSAASCPESPGLSQTSVTFGADGTGDGAVDVTGSGHCGYAVEVSSGAQSWLSADATQVDGGETVTLSAATNSGAERTGTVTVGTRMVSVTQSAAACPEAPGLSQTSVTFGADGTGDGAVDVTGSGHCGYAVEVSSGAQSWLGTDATQVDGGETVTLSAATNSGAERTGTVTVGTSTVSVTQSAAACPEAPGLSQTSVTFGADGTGDGAVDVTGSGHCGYDVAVSSGSSWLSADVARVSGGGTVTLSATVNSDASARMGTVTVGTATVSVTQSATACSAELAPTSVTFEADGTGSGAVTVSGSAQCGYDVAVSGAASSWLSADVTRVSGGGTVTLSAATNTGGERTGTVTVGTGVVSVTQWTATCPAAPVVTPGLVSHQGAGGSTPVAVRGSSSCQYAVSAVEAWVTVDPAEVSGGGTVTVTVAEDVDGAGARRGTVTVGDTGVRVAQGNTTPAAVADAVTAWRETETPVAVLDNDTDADGDPLSVASVAPAPANGTAAVSADGQSVTYTSAAGWSGVETFTYSVTDGFGGTAEATVTVTVRAATPFTDPVLTAEVTPIKAAHMTELRTRTNAVRVGCGLAEATWTDAVLTAGVTPVKAAHMTELRAAVTAAYAACVRTAPVWTDAVLTAGVTPIKAAHLLELREAVIALE